MKLEICCYNLPSCLIAAKAGANRIELCANPADGGTTASYATIKTVKEKTGIDVFPIIRPRGGDFLYDDDEFDIMQKDILLCKSLGCEGVVIGMLQADGAIDIKRNAKLVELAYPMSVTFHRAFDRVADPFNTLQTLIQIGCERILTSGQRPTAMEGAELLQQLVNQAGEDIIIMPGAGIRASNIAELAAKTGAAEFHSSASKKINSLMQFVNPHMNESLQLDMAVEEEIAQMIKILNKSE
jgi:copper homeostasis protein